MIYSERGYLANSTNFGTIKGKVKVLLKYDPVNSIITIVNIDAKNTALKAILASKTQKIGVYTFQVAGRQVKFEDVDSKATRIGGAFASCDVSAKDILIVHNQVKRIRGERILALKKIVTPTVTPETDTPTTDTTSTPIENIAAAAATTTTHSVSHVSFSNLVSALLILITLLEASTEYDTNVDDLKLPALKLWVKDLETVSISTDAAHNDIVAVDVERDDLFYDAKDSGLNMVQKIKAEVLASYGATSKEYKEIKAIPFIDNRRKL
ncbi:MAG: hypothetical protein WCL51_11920 [Bacteroidota bacterium]